MPIDKLINLGVTLTLVEMMLTIGLGVTFAQVAGVARNGRLVAKATIANYILAPAAAAAVLALFHPDPMVAAGFLLAAVCPGAAYGPPFTAMAKGNVPMSVGLMVILAGSSAIAAPLLLSILLSQVGGGEGLKVDTFKVASTLLFWQLVPLCIGLALRHRRPELAARLKIAATRLGTEMNLVVFAAILVVQFRLLTDIHLMGFIGMLLLVVVFTAIGWLLGGPAANNRRAMALSTGVRNVSVSLVIATGSFPDTPAVTAALVFAIFQTILLAAAAAIWGRVGNDRRGAALDLAA